MKRIPIPNGRPPRILGVFAHPDDEVFCLGGTMAKCIAEGGAGKIISLTKGEAGEIRDVNAASRRTLGAVRSVELARSARVLGVTDTMCFDFPDGALADQPYPELVEQVGLIADEFEPDLVISFGPDGAYGHPDHVAASDIATRAAALSNAQPTMLHAVFPRSGTMLLNLLVEWLSSLDGRFMGSSDFANGLMLFADGSSMLGYAADHLAVRFYPAGTFIVEQGEPPNELFLVLSGMVDVIVEDEHGSLSHLAQTGPGSFVGEDGIATGQPRNAHVVASTSVTCFVLSPGRADLAAGRGRNAQRRPVAEQGVSELLPSAHIEVDVTEFAAQKMTALACHRSQYAIAAEMFPASLVEGIFGTEYFAQAETPN